MFHSLNFATENLLNKNNTYKYMYTDATEGERGRVEWYVGWGKIVGPTNSVRALSYLHARCDGQVGAGGEGGGGGRVGTTFARSYSDSTKCYTPHNHYT